MFGLSRQEKLMRKMKKSGITVTGEITEIFKGNILPEFLQQITGRNEQGIVIHVKYKTKENTDEEMLMNVKDESPYTVGSPFTVRYIFFNNHFIALPESLFKKEK